MLCAVYPHDVKCIQQEVSKRVTKTAGVYYEVKEGLKNPATLNLNRLRDLCGTLAHTDDNSQQAQEDEDERTGFFHTQVNR
jgi:hypothetical protein